LERFSRYLSAWLFRSTVLLACLLVTACASAQSAPAPATSASGGANPNNAQPVSQNATVVPTKPPTTEPLAATVNGKPITVSMLERVLTRRMEGMRTLGDPAPADMKAFRETVLTTLIEQMLIEDAAAVQKVTVTDAEVDAELQANIAIAGGKEKWLVQLKANLMSEAEFRDGLRSALLTAKMRDIVVAGVGNTAEQVHARHILVSSEATANEMLTKIKAKADFAALAAQYSQDTSTRDIGGDLGWFAKGELLEPTVEDAAFGLQANEVSTPVKSNLGYHIIQALERVKDRPISPETRYKLAARVFDTWKQTLVAKAKIEKFNR